MRNFLYITCGKVVARYMCATRAKCTKPMRAREEDQCLTLTRNSLLVSSQWRVLSASPSIFTATCPTFTSVRPLHATPLSAPPSRLLDSPTPPSPTPSTQTDRTGMVSVGLASSCSALSCSTGHWMSSPKRYVCHLNTDIIINNRRPHSS